MQFDTDMPKIDREKVHLCHILANMAKYFHKHSPEHFFSLIKAAYSDSASRYIERDILDQIRKICVQKVDFEISISCWN